METRTRRETIKLRSDDRENSVGTIVGYGAVFYREGDESTEYRLFDDVVERVAPGAFEETIKTDDVRALFNHEPDNLLGRQGAGTLSAKEDERGLAYEIQLPNTQLGRDVRELVERGDVYGSSFSFNVVRESWERTEDGLYIRTLEKVRAYDFGPVTFPAYEGSSAQARSGEKSPTRDEIIAAAERSLAPNEPNYDYYRARARIVELGI